jgi:DNA-binding PadR family transcriptional regulator
MAIRLVILGLLSRRPLYGYEIKHIIEDHMGDWTDIKFGSIYFALSKLTEAGDLEIIAETRAGKRPAKTVYQITPKGKAEFFRLLKQLWSEPERTYYSFDIALFFMNNLDPAEVDQYLQNRIKTVAAQLDKLNRHRTEHSRNPEIPKQALSIMNHSYYHLEAEYKWLQELLRDLRK